MSQQNIPKYIDDFIKTNFEKLIEIYNTNMKELNSDESFSMLSFKCKEKENKMDVTFMNKDLLLVNFKEEDWTKISEQRGDKKIFFIEDLDRNTHYLLYV